MSGWTSAADRTGYSGTKFEDDLRMDPKAKGRQADKLPDRTRCQRLIVVDLLRKYNSEIAGIHMEKLCTDAKFQRTTG